MLASPDALATRPARVGRAFVARSVPANDPITADVRPLACATTAADGMALRGRAPPLASSVGVSGRRCLNDVDEGCCWRCLNELDDDCIRLEVVSRNDAQVKIELLNHTNSLHSTGPRSSRSEHHSPEHSRLQRLFRERNSATAVLIQNYLAVVPDFLQDVRLGR